MQTSDTYILYRLQSIESDDRFNSKSGPGRQCLDTVCFNFAGQAQEKFKVVQLGRSPVTKVSKLGARVICGHCAKKVFDERQLD